MRKWIVLGALVIVITVGIGATAPLPTAAQDNDLSCVEQVAAIQAAKDDVDDIVERYRPLRVVDVHNHDAIMGLNAVERWDDFGIDVTALFGAISSPQARFTDAVAFEVFRQNPDRVYPFFAGVSIYEDDGLEMLRGDLEKGYFGIGEIVGASTYSPLTNKLPWKAEHPNDGHFPELYRLSAEYGVLVLLHIDPPFGYPIMKLEEALDENPDALIAFGHANAYNPPENIEPLMRDHPNLYFDFYAGFTAYNPESENTLADFVPLIEAYPDRTFISTDSGAGITYDEAATAIYELFDLLTPETVCRVAHENIDAIIDAQLPTEAQRDRIEELAPDVDIYALNKLAAHILIFNLEAEE